MNWNNLLERVPELIVQYGANALIAIAIFLIGRIIGKRIIQWVSHTMKARGIDPTAVGFVANIANVVMLVALAVAAMGQLGIPTTSFIAVIGAAGLAIGLALQGSLSNFASGVLLVTLKPCEVGDYIETNGLGGTVAAITMFSTTLETPDNRVIVVPNSSLFSNPITNYSTANTRRIDLVFGIGYSDDIAEAKRIILDVVESDDRVLGSEPVQVGVLSLSESSVDIAVRPWVNSSDYWPVRFDLNEGIKQAFDAKGIEIPFRQLSVHMVKADTEVS